MSCDGRVWWWWWSWRCWCYSGLGCVRGYAQGRTRQLLGTSRWDESLGLHEAEELAGSERVLGTVCYSAAAAATTTTNNNNTRQTWGHRDDETRKPATAI